MMKTTNPKPRLTLATGRYSTLRDLDAADLKIAVGGIPRVIDATGTTTAGSRA